MKINKIYEKTFDIDQTIVSAKMSSKDEAVLLMSTGNVVRHNINDETTQAIFTAKSPFSHSDGGFDINAQTTIYTLDSIIVVVNDYKRHGFVHYPGKYNALHLWRGEYHADISTYPIALFKNDEGIPHIIYGADWNHVQIMNLDTRQILTAAKSLIEVNAEESHIEFYKNHKESNKLPWPSQYDYFFGELHISPDRKKFLSAGWFWGSYDACNAYDIEHFITNNRIADISIGGWEHENRAICWIDSDTVAVAYEPLAEFDKGATKETPTEIHLYKIDGEAAEIEKKIPIVGPKFDTVSFKMYYDVKVDSIIILSSTMGVTAIGLDGKIKFQDKNLSFDNYNIETGLFLKTIDKTIWIYEIEI